MFPTPVYSRRTFKSPPVFLCVYSSALAGPLIFGTIPNSFFSWNQIKGTHNWIGIKNFVDLVHDRDFIQSMFLTFKLAVVTIVLTNVLAFFIALALNTHIFGKPVIRAFFFIPNIISGVMIALAWTFIFQKVTPIIGELLHSEAVTGFSWFGSSTAAFAAVSVVTVWQGLGFLMILYITGLQSIPLDVMEAACIDGCVGLNRIIKIQLPLLMPTITINQGNCCYDQKQDHRFRTAIPHIKSSKCVIINIHGDRYEFN